MERIWTTEARTTVWDWPWDSVEWLDWVIMALRWSRSIESLELGAILSDAGFYRDGISIKKTKQVAMTTLDRAAIDSFLY
jgi:hypothetical protein